KGEVTSFKAQGKAVYFSIRDAVDGSTLSVFMWMSDFDLAGIALTEGLEVVIEGRSEIYKPSGRFSFRAETIQPVGEGAFKKAYDELKKKMEVEGLFIPERKRKLKEHPVRIGLVTSRSGAVIHDFLSNLGKFGFHVAFVDSRVEGAGAVKDILSALSVLESKDLDVLVLIRGGGSLESLQAFNNEHVVRKIAEFPAVTICAIGHDKDVPLVQLVADYAPSTPTATTTLLNASWQESIHELSTLSIGILSHFEQDIWQLGDTLRNTRSELEEYLDVLLRPFRQLVAGFNDSLVALARILSSKKDEIVYAEKALVEQYRLAIKHTAESLLGAGKSLAQNDPMRQLRLGYSILTKKERVIRSIHDIAPGERFEARLADGTLVGEVIDKIVTNE
ncbi:MAG: Exodeoxyribonuclease 7 large subunit, partial [Parcubacteria group bacterium GW2011_GWA2_47_7]